MALGPAVVECLAAPDSPPEARPFRIIPNLRPLLFHRNVLYCARFNQIFATEDWGEHLTPVAELSLSSRCLQWIQSLPSAQRLLRAAVYRMRILADGTMVFVFRGGVYRLEPGATRAERTFRVPRGIRPVSLGTGPDGSVFFGEYWSNPNREPVHVYGSGDGARSWRIVHTFPAADIRHVHGIIHDPWDECFWVCTGDQIGECRLFRASPDFSRIEQAACNGQLTRFYSIHVGPTRLIMATDSPRFQNYTMVFTKSSRRLEKKQPIENSSFYHCEVNGRIFISTNAEPSPVNDERQSHVWMGDSTGEQWRRCLSFPVDFYSKLSRVPGLPKGLFQYPRVFFPDGPNDSSILACQAIGLKGFAGSMLCYDTADWTF
jgi:hypothetical protein